MQLNFDNIINTKEDLLSKLSEQSIYEYYLGNNIKQGKLYRCPFHEDRTPSMGFKIMDDNNLIFNCFSCGSKGNIINFVSKLYNLTYKETLNKIKEDMLVGNTIRSSPTTSSNFTKSSSKLYIVKQNFNIIDFNYWKQYYITLDLLNKYNISACKQVFLKRSDTIELIVEYKKDNPAYCYTIDGTYKIYRPLSPTKSGKWYNTTGHYNIQGLAQLPSSGDLLFITSSMKDLLVLKVLGYDAIALGGEGNDIPIKVLDYLFACFKEIIIFYDNDEAGIKYAEKFSTKYNLRFIYIPSDFYTTSNIKDISDYIKTYGINSTKELIKELLDGREERKWL